MILNRKQPQPLDEQRVHDLRQEIEEYIDSRVAALKASSPSIPEKVIRNILTARSGGCHCEMFLHVKMLADEETALASSQKKAKGAAA